MYLDCNFIKAAHIILALSSLSCFALFGQFYVMICNIDCIGENKQRYNATFIERVLK